MHSRVSVGRPGIHTLLLLGWPQTTPFSRISSGDITSCSKNVPGLASNGTTAQEGESHAKKNRLQPRISFQHEGTCEMKESLELLQVSGVFQDWVRGTFTGLV